MADKRSPRVRRLILDVKYGEHPEAGWVWMVEWRGFGRRVWTKQKTTAVRDAANHANQHALEGGIAQVVIRTMDGRIQSERTYPRSSDPKRHRG